MTKSKKINLKNLTPEEQLKYEIAQELGVFDKVMKSGWKSLSAKETGKIGGLVAKRKKELSQQ
ncbi:MAG: alpha/beta-type small acid-soluble spore protein [Lachnospiraceae bacterium]|nr:alpha/beta-type small acid-soluble spore protein [Lachnospiraceae bacterium]MDE6698020.1 alpha/beta-type small acid-soluble spore protein [Lachnospiraceae bacterium]